MLSSLSPGALKLFSQGTPASLPSSLNDRPSCWHQGLPQRLSRSLDVAIFAAFFLMTAAPRTGRCWIVRFELQRRLFVSEAPNIDDCTMGSAVLAVRAFLNRSACSVSPSRKNCERREHTSGAMTKRGFARTKKNLGGHAPPHVTASWNGT